MPLLRSRLSLVRTARWRPEYELREEGRALGRLLWDGAPGTAQATIGDRTWTMRPGTGRSAIEARDGDGELGASLRAGAITVAGELRPVVTWRRNRTAGTCAELVGSGCSALVRTRRNTAPGIDVAIEGELVERELLVLLAGYDLLR